VGYYYDIALNVPQWQTMIFTTLAFAQIFQAFAVRSTDTSAFRMSLLSNRMLLVTSGAVLFSQLAVLYIPFLQTFFNTVPLTLADLAVCFGLGSLVLFAIELEKWWNRRGEKKRAFQAAALMF